MFSPHARPHLLSDRELELLALRDTCAIRLSALGDDLAACPDGDPRRPELLRLYQIQERAWAAADQAYGRC